MKKENKNATAGISTRHNPSVRIENATAGITLVSLVITIIVILILAGTVTVAGLDSVREAKKTAFITELEMIQEKVDTIYEKRKLNEENIAYYDTLGKDLSFVDQSKLNMLLDGKEETGYRYFSKEDLKQLDLDNMNQDVIINFSTRDVASIVGFEIENTVCYRLPDIPGYRVNNVEYTNKNTQSPTFDVEVTQLSDSWLITVKNIVYNSNVGAGTLSYKTTNSSEWIIVGENNFFKVEQYGSYDIRYTDSAGNSTTIQKIIE